MVLTRVVFDTERHEYVLPDHRVIPLAAAVFLDDSDFVFHASSVDDLEGQVRSLVKTLAKKGKRAEYWQAYQHTFTDKNYLYSGRLLKGTPRDSPSEFVETQSALYHRVIQQSA